MSYGAERRSETIARHEDEIASLKKEVVELRGRITTLEASPAPSHLLIEKAAPYLSASGVFASLILSVLLFRSHRRIQKLEDHIKDNEPSIQPGLAPVIPITSSHGPSFMSGMSAEPNPTDAQPILEINVDKK